MSALTAIGGGGGGGEGHPLNKGRVPRHVSATAERHFRPGPEVMSEDLLGHALVSDWLQVLASEGATEDPQGR